MLFLFRRSFNKLEPKRARCIILSASGLDPLRCMLMGIDFMSHHLNYRTCLFTKLEGVPENPGPNFLLLNSIGLVQTKQILYVLLKNL